MVSMIDSKRENDQNDVVLDVSSCFVVEMVRHKN